MGGDQTFLFADLAGYTALTEAHGDDAAADVALAFCEELNRRLPSGAEDLKMLGDSCLVRSPDAAGAARLGIALVEEVGMRQGFPRVRVGMHTGGAVERNGDWFGGGVNIAARTVECAGAGEVLLTEATLRSAGPLRGLVIEDRGLRTLRHLTEPQHLFRIRSTAAPRDLRVEDPVCRMQVGIEERAASVVQNGVEYSFCSEACATEFARMPEAYAERG